MLQNDKTMLFDRINALHEVYGKSKLTPAAAQMWWDTVKEFDHNDVFTVLGYWAQQHNKQPLPADVWKACNDKRTEGIEEKARIERASNRSMLPYDFRPTEYGRKMIKECLGMMARKEQEGRHEWARKIVRMHENGEHVPFFTLKLARNRLNETIGAEA